MVVVFIISCHQLKLRTTASGSKMFFFFFFFYLSSCKVPHNKVKTLARKATVAKWNFSQIALVFILLSVTKINGNVTFTPTTELLPRVPLIYANKIKKIKTNNPLTWIINRNVVFGRLWFKFGRIEWLMRNGHVAIVHQHSVQYYKENLQESKNNAKLHGENSL